MRIGHGFDVHAFGEGDFITLGGVRIPHSRGLIAHSDGDVLLHALCDALLGAAGLGDIGTFFPDSDPRWKGADSLKLLENTRARLGRRRVVHVDVTLLAEAPRIGPYKNRMRTKIARALRVPLEGVSVKAKTNEGMGFVGRREGLAALAVAGVVA